MRVRVTGSPRSRARSKSVWLVHVVLGVAHLDEDVGLRRGRQVVEGTVEEAIVLAIL